MQLQLTDARSERSTRPSELPSNFP